MHKIACVVEGHGEVEALPVLIRRIAIEADPQQTLKIFSPIRISASQFLNFSTEFSRTLALAAAQCESSGSIFILLDCEDDCPATLGPEILRAAIRELPHIKVYVCLAYREYESWFIAAIESLGGKRTIFPDMHAPEYLDNIRDAKGWIGRAMSKAKYSPPLDQAALTAAMDFTSARRSDSFDKCHREITAMIRAKSSHP